MPSLDTTDLEALLPQVDTLSDQAARRLYQGIAHETLARCVTDGLHWLSYVRTRDESDPACSVKPFPVHLEYARHLWQVFHDRQCVIVAKSRQMLVSWTVAAFCCWWARFKPHQAIYWQAQKKEDACAMIAMAEGNALGRCHFIETSLPSWMRLPVKAMEGTLVYPDGSFIQALPGGANQIRGKVMSVYIGDEFAHQEEASGTWTTVAPLVQKGAKAILVSTPNGTGNQFAYLYHGRAIGGE